MQLFFFYQSVLNPNYISYKYERFDHLFQVLNESFDAEELSQLDDLHTSRITRILTNDFPMYFAVVTRVRQEVHCVGPEGGVILSSVVPRVQVIHRDSFQKFCLFRAFLTLYINVYFILFLSGFICYKFLYFHGRCFIGSSSRLYFRMVL